MKSDTDRLVAAFRWSVIAPLTQSDLTTRDYRQKRRAILETTHTDPLRGPRKLSASALKRWLKAFLTGECGLFDWELPGRLRDASNFEPMLECTRWRSHFLARQHPVSNSGWIHPCQWA